MEDLQLFIEAQHYWARTTVKLCFCWNAVILFERSYLTRKIHEWQHVLCGP